MATGTPVVANAVGGTAETVVEGVTGALVHDWTPDELRSAVDRAVGADADACVARAFEFDTPVFEKRIREWVATEAGASIPSVSDGRTS